MKSVFLLVALVGLPLGAQATEYAQVISSTPVLGEVSVPQRNCWDEQVQVEQPHTPEGAVIGAVAGGLLGSTMGRGSGNVAATAAGVIAGAVAGDSLANRNSTSTETVHRCDNRRVTQRKTIGYDVVYEYAGQQYTARMANDPGSEIAINVTPSGASAPVANQDSTTVIEQGPTVVYRQPAPVYVAPPVMLGWWGWGGDYHRPPPHFRH